MTEYLPPEPSQPPQQPEAGADVQPEADVQAAAVSEAVGASQAGEGDAVGGVVSLEEFEGGIAELIAQAGDSGEPLGLEPAETGHAGVDTALARLAELDGVPAEEHAGVYEDVHERLQGILAALDRPPGPPAPAAAPYNADIARRS